MPVCQECAPIQATIDAESDDLVEKLLACDRHHGDVCIGTTRIAVHVTELEAERDAAHVGH